MSDSATWYAVVLQQMAAEAYFEDTDLSSERAVTQSLVAGNNRFGFNAGLTRFADEQVAEFLNEFRIAAQGSDKPSLPRRNPIYYAGTNIVANSGLAATLSQKNGTNEFTLSIRSTEFQPWAKGGDRERDGFGADIAGIFGQGFAFAQIDALDRYYEFLKTTINPATGQFFLPAGATLNVTGYSL